MSQTEFYPVLYSIVSNYTSHKILQRRFNAKLQSFVTRGPGEAICTPGFASSTIKFLGDEVTAEFNETFKAVLSTAAADHIVKEHAKLFSDEAYERSFRVSLERLPLLVKEMGDVIFKDKQNMGTVGAFLAFGASFSAYCEQKYDLGLPAVDTVVRSVAKHLDDNLQSCWKTNGGLGMIRSAELECVNRITASRQRKVQFVESLQNLMAKHNLQSANPQFYTEMNKIVAELQDLLRLKDKSYESSGAELSMEHKQVAPPEINFRGRLALEAYHKALTEGKTKVRRIPVMLIGQDRSGKTSLKKSLRGIPFDPDQDSTVGIDVDPSYFKVTKEIWKAGEKNPSANAEAMTYEQCTARLVVESLKEREFTSEKRTAECINYENDPLVDPVAPSVTPSSDNSEVSSMESNTTTHDSNKSPDVSKATQSNVSRNPAESSGPSTVPVSDAGNDGFKTPPYLKFDLKHSLVSNSDEIPDEIETLIKKLLEEVDNIKDEDDIYSVLWDFGGQSVYYMTHPLFLTPRALYILVYDLSRHLHERARPVMKQGMYKKIEDSFGTKTNLDCLDYWMNSVASLASHEAYAMDSGLKSSLLPWKLPPVFLVCTHADQPHREVNPFKLAHEVCGSLQTKSYKNHLYDDVFVVDNTKSGFESECSEVTRLRERLLAVAKELPQMKEVIPIKWLKYEKALQVTLEEGHKWITLGQAKQIASEVCQIHNKQEFVTLLNFLHDQRILIHFDDTAELNKLVVLDPQWLINVFKKVITVQPYGYREKEIKELWHKLETTGILEEKLLQHVWDPLIDQHETTESLIAIMEKFSLLCAWPSSDDSRGKQYLVPSMLMSHPPQDIVELIASAEIPSLFLKFESGLFPLSLFPRLVLQFFHWGKDEFWSSMTPVLYQNFARFYTARDEDCSVVFLCHSSSIEVVVLRGNVTPRLAEDFQTKLGISAGPQHGSFEVFCARAVHRQLSLILECMRKQFCWMKNMVYQVGFLCSVCCQGKLVRYCHTHHKQSCEREECLHFLLESELCSVNQFVTCTRSATAINNKVYIKDFAAWFAAGSHEQVETDAIDGRRFLATGEGNEGKSLALPEKVLESLISHSCDPKEIVLQLKESLHLEQTCLEQPEPRTKKMIRYLAKKAKDSNRIDVVKHLREITPAGTTGPLLPGNLDIRSIPVSQMTELTISLSGGDEWKEVAERLGLRPTEIRYLDNRTLNPCYAALAFISQRCHIDADDLYDVLTESGLPLLADTL